MTTYPSYFQKRGLLNTLNNSNPKQSIFLDRTSTLIKLFLPTNNRINKSRWFEVTTNSSIQSAIAIKNISNANLD